ncbi:MBL fold metallo-hydrolase [Roseibacterium beibuensis]|nr:MBL fold metallo-hydrolase [Roseibacterium beibuensis]MCS6621627.1 MBL fold metallo-hydrolase [Roseibacterium beibuensis]
MTASKRATEAMERGRPMRLEKDLRLILAPNPSPMTFKGTNTYLLGTGEVAVIDPGPALPEHLEAILGALDEGECISTILVTHSHKDHSGLARDLARATGAPILAAGPSDWGRRAIMQELARTGEIGGGEGVDPDFAPDSLVREGATVVGRWGRIDVLETPGHMANHLSFAWNGALFSGDLIMGWSTSLVSPPDGDMTAFMDSVCRLAARDDRIYYPGHGDPVTRPQDRAQELLAHRRNRETQIRAALSELATSDATTLARRIYDDIAPELIPAAARNVLAHLIDMLEKTEVEALDPPHPGMRFRIART